MRNVKLTWDSFGEIDSYSVYRSESVIDVESPPTPIATGITAKEYTDSYEHDGGNVHYVVSSIKSAAEKFSDELIVALPYLTTITTKLRANYAKSEVLNIPISITSADSAVIVSSSVISGPLPSGLTLSANTLTGTITTDGTYNFTIEVLDDKSRTSIKSFSVQVAGSLYLYTQFDTSTDKIDGTWTLGSGNSLVSDVTRKGGLKTLRFGNGSAVATAVATFSKLPPRSIWNGNYTVCGWIRRHASMVAQKLWKYGNTGSNTDRDTVQFTTQKGAQFYRNSNGTIMNLNGSYTGDKSLLAEWIHIAEVRKNNVAYLFIDGQLVATQALSASISVDRNFMLGGLRASSVMVYTDPLWIDEIKVYQGVGLWDTDYDVNVEW